MDVRWMVFVGFILNMAGLAGIYYKLSVIVYQHGLMWDDFSERKQLHRTQKEKQ